ncbi:MAG: hypothetical protein JWQ43_444, partial [Glaciihabitans sp.]|nr:hypothetical protein [Glaciihabitans sp.]
MDALNALILSLADSPLVMLVLLLLVTIDGFFPPVPSETAIVALAAIGAASGTPNVALILLVAAVGSFLGDNITFNIGRRVGLTRFRWMQGERISRLVGGAKAGLERRPVSVVLTGRFVPVGRVAVNLVAGASGMPRRRFVALSSVSAVAWAGYSILVGMLAGAWFGDNPILGATIAVVAALGIGLVIDRASNWVSTRSVGRGR